MHGKQEDGSKCCLMSERHRMHECWLIFYVPAYTTSVVWEILMAPAIPNANSFVGDVDALGTIGGRPRDTPATFFYFIVLNSHPRIHSLSLYRIFVFHVCAHARRSKCKHTHVGQAFLKLPLQFRTSWLQLQPYGPTMDFHHALTPFTKGNDAAQTQVDQPDLGMFVEVRVREHPPRWIRGKYVHWGVECRRGKFVIGVDAIAPPTTTTSTRPSSCKCHLRRYPKRLVVCVVHRCRRRGESRDIYQRAPSRVERGALPSLP